MAAAALWIEETNGDPENQPFIDLMTKLWPLRVRGVGDEFFSHVQADLAFQKEESDDVSVLVRTYWEELRPAQDDLQRAHHRRWVRDGGQGRALYNFKGRSSAPEENEKPEVRTYTIGPPHSPSLQTKDGHPLCKTQTCCMR